MLLAACTPSSNLELAVDVLSDLQPGLEVDRFEVRMDDVSVYDGLPTGPISDGARAVDLEVEAGDHIIAGRAFFNNEMVAERRVLVQVREDQALTVVLTRNCRGVECDEAGTTCANAMCVDPQCSPETPEFCASAQCQVGTDCEPAGVCGSVECRRGACLLVDDGRCGSGLFCGGDEGCLVAPFLSDVGVADVGSPDVASPDAGGPDVPPLPDAGPDVTSTVCAGSWGALPVESAAVVGANIGGTSNLSVTPSSALLAPVMTIDLWVRFLEPMDSMALMGNATREGGGFLVGVARTPGGEARVTYVIEGMPYLFDAIGLLDQCWHHIALVRDLPAGRVSYIQDGEVRTVNLAARTTSLMAGEVGLFVGRNTFGDEPRAHVAVHHLRFWNTALSGAELTVLRTTPAPAMDTRLIGSIPMQMTVLAEGLEVLGSRGTLEAFLGWYIDPRGNAPGMLMTLDELDIYAAGF